MQRRIASDHAIEGDILLDGEGAFDLVVHRAHYAAASMSVRAKSLPLNNSGSSVALASAGKAVAKVQARFVAALAEIEKRLSRQFAMIERHRFDRDAGAAKEGFGLAHPFGTELAFDDHRQLDIAGDADAAGIGIMDGLCEGRRFGFAIEDRDPGRRVEEHFGRPLSS